VHFAPATHLDDGQDDLPARCGWQRLALVSGLLGFVFVFAVVRFVL